MFHTAKQTNLLNIFINSIVVIVDLVDIIRYIDVDDISTRQL